jgi:hypothetical protein
MEPMVFSQNGFVRKPSRRGAVGSFVQKHFEKITGILSCLGRLLDSQGLLAHQLSSEHAKRLSLLNQKNRQLV